MVSISHEPLTWKLLPSGEGPVTKLISPRRPGLVPLSLGPSPQVYSTPWRGVVSQSCSVPAPRTLQSFCTYTNTRDYHYLGAHVSGCVTCVLWIYHDFIKGPYFGALRSFHLANTQESRGSPRPLLLPHVEVLLVTSACGYK